MIEINNLQDVVVVKNPQKGKIHYYVYTYMDEKWEMCEKEKATIGVINGYDENDKLIYEGMGACNGKKFVAPIPEWVKDDKA